MKSKIGKNMIISLLGIVITVSLLYLGVKPMSDNSRNTVPMKATSVLMTEKNDTISENSTDSILIRIADKAYTARLYDNDTAKAFSDLLPLTIDMSELHANEKYYNLNNALPADSSNVGKINNGDLMLYGSDCVVLFYDSFETPYSYTKIGYIENPSDLADAVGSGKVTVTFEKQ